MKLLLNRCLLLVVCVLLGVPQAYAAKAKDLDVVHEKSPTKNNAACTPQTEICDGKDNDCDNLIDEDLKDVDKDGICDEIDPLIAKTLPPSLIDKTKKSEPNVAHPLKEKKIPDFTAPVSSNKPSLKDISEGKAKMIEAQKLKEEQEKQSLIDMKRDVAKERNKATDVKPKDPMADIIDATRKRKEQAKQIPPLIYDNGFDRLKPKDMPPLVDPDIPDKVKDTVVALADYSCPEGGGSVEVKCDKTFNVKDDECARCYTEDKSVVISVSGEACNDIRWKIPREKLKDFKWLKEPVRATSTDDEDNLMVMTDRQIVQISFDREKIRTMMTRKAQDASRDRTVKFKTENNPDANESAVYKIVGALEICKAKPVDLCTNIECLENQYCSDGACKDKDPNSICPDGSEPSDEICDAVDNDCDGQVDEEIPDGPLPSPIEEHIGTCLTQFIHGGYTRCIDGKMEIQCNPPSCPDGSEPSDEICDGKDNDCDGEIDEDIASELIPVECGQDLQEMVCVDGQMVTRPLAEVMVSALSVDLDCGPPSPAPPKPPKPTPNEGGSAASGGDGGGCSLSVGHHQSMPIWFMALLTIPALALGFRQGARKRL